MSWKIALLVTVLGLQSCAVANAVTTDTGRSGQVYVGFALDVEGRVTPGCTANTFALGDPIHLSLQVSEAPKDTTLHVAIRDLVTQRIAWSEDRPLLTGQSSATFSIGRKLGPGRYRAESSLDGESMSPREFVVHGRRTVTTDAVGEDPIVGIAATS